MNLVLSVLIFMVTTVIVRGAEVHYTPCGDASWIPYKDEKCFKLVRFFTTRHQAQQICNEEYSAVSVATLVTIKSAAEQMFLTEYVFNSSNENSVWIGAQRRPNSATEFDWIDGTPVDRFTNWEIGSPSNVIERSCVQMQSIYSRTLSDMQWRDISCNVGQWFICEKLQEWPIEQFQRTIMSVRKDVQVLAEELTTLQANPVPIGFIYVQLSGQPEPQSIWEAVTWTEVTSQYDGLFFRAVGEGSAEFGSIQSEFSPRLTRVERVNIVNMFSANLEIPTDGSASSWINTGQANTSNSWGLRFTVSAGEVRPRNSAIRIWRRSA